MDIGEANHWLESSAEELHCHDWLPRDAHVACRGSGTGKLQVLLGDSVADEDENTPAAAWHVPVVRLLH